jgi:hypothetical protein
MTFSPNHCGNHQPAGCPSVAGKRKCDSRLGRGLIMMLVLAGPGCIATQPWISNSEPSTPMGICQVHAFWDGQVRVTPDVVNGGRPLPGLAGRLYLMGPEFGKTEKGDGSVTVDLYDISNPQPGTQRRHLERWQLDAGNMAKLFRKDKIGWGYTLFLPLSAYGPEVTRVELNVCYTPAKGTPLYAEPTPLSLRNQLTSTQTRQLAVQPAGPNGPSAARQ